MTIGLNVFELLTPKSSVSFILDNFTVRQAVEKMLFHKFTVIPILNNEGEYVGTISEGDLLRFIVAQDGIDKEECESILIKDIDKYRSYKSVKVDASFDEIYEASLIQNFIPIVDDRNVFIGIIRRKEVVSYIKKLVDECKNVPSK
ncbi:MAG: CBS domain-containing protein [Bacilli bacterium]|nr:CBS domain-containing protein [Bacilli bacterium]